MMKTKVLAYTLSILLLSMTAPLAALAQESGRLSPEVPAPDTSQPSDTGSGVGQQTVLQGKVHKHNQPDEINAGTGQNESNLSGQSEDSSADLQTQNGSPDQSPAYRLALQKLASKVKLTTEDFRALGIGILGYNSDRKYFQPEARVSRVYPGLPAEEAGMKVGDVIIVHNAQKKDAKIKDPTTPVWLFSCGIAGQPVDLTVQRHGQSLQLHMVEMNIEDIPDVKLKRQYEDMVEQTGGPVHNAPITPPTSPVSILKGLSRLIGL